MRIRMRIQFFIPDPGGKPMRIQADPDPSQTLRSQKVQFLQEK
jgi:hypothetical protein